MCLDRTFQKLTVVINSSDNTFSVDIRNPGDPSEKESKDVRQLEGTADKLGLESWGPIYSDAERGWLTRFQMRRRDD